jgi:hypothetical protein
VTEEKQPEQNLIYTLKITSANFEISTSGNLKQIYSQIDEIGNLVEALTSRLEISPNVQEDLPTEEEIETVPADDVPIIKVSRSTMDNVTALFASEWGRKPRTLAEIMKALEVNTVPDKASTINTYLRRLVQRGNVRRFKKEGLYNYLGLPPEE